MANMERDATFNALRDFVAKDLLNGDSRELDGETPLLAWGIIDSMSLLRLVDFIEETLKVTIPADDLADSDNLQNLASITAMVDRHRPRT